MWRYTTASESGGYSGVMGRAPNSVLKLAVSSEPPPQKMSTVEQTLAVLRFLANARTPLGVNAISRELNMPTSSCFRILKQLSEEDFAQFDHANKCYSLGSGAVMLARRALDPSNTFGLIQPSLSQFVGETQTSVGFWRRIDRNRIVLAGFLESPHPMRIHMSVGQRLPLFIGAVGRAFAAELQLSDDDIDHELSKLRWQFPPDVAQYLQQVRDYNDLGYSIDSGNFAPGVTTVATVLTDTVGGASYGLSAIRLSGQVDDRTIAEIGEALVRLKQDLLRKWLGRP